MTNKELIHQFETDALPNGFHHADHVQLAYAYLCQHPVLQALEKFTPSLKRFATLRGKPDLYHETITHAYFFLIRERMARHETSSATSHASHNWQEFAHLNPDLLVWKNGILSRYYEEATLQSDFARSVFVFPDRIA